MIPSESNKPIPNKYFLLQEGDIIEDGDEYYNPFTDQWVLCTDENDGECPKCGSTNIEEQTTEDNSNSKFHCFKCGNEFQEAIWPEGMIGWEYDPEEFKPIRRKNLDYKET